MTESLYVTADWSRFVAPSAKEADKPADKAVRKPRNK